jgi:hypothetical protein
MLTRRELGGKVAVGAAALLATGVARASFGSAPQDARALTQAGLNGSPDAQDLPGSEVLPSGQVGVVDSGPPATLAAQPPWELLRPLTVGSVVSSGWTIAGFTGAVDGSCVVTLQNERGRQNRVHICRNDGDPKGLVYTRDFDLLVMNGGKGDLPTEESFGQAVAELAHVLAANEGSTTVVASLMPHADRLRMCGESDRRLR